MDAMSPGDIHRLRPGAHLAHAKEGPGPRKAANSHPLERFWAQWLLLFGANHY